MAQQWDTKLGNTRGKPNLSRVIFPVAISKTLVEREYDRVIITITEEGLLLKPYKSDLSSNYRLDTAELPKW